MWLVSRIDSQPDAVFTSMSHSDARAATFSISPQRNAHSRRNRMKAVKLRTPSSSRTSRWR